ncbi:FHA domain-containing protein [Verrucomicrobiales bacterium BCK34]|nr:FHA domain-containing protein [Verrucomicrobiales bacterium BCK34]
MPTITLYVPDQEPYALDISGLEQVTVGRAEENSIVIDHGSLSGSHAVITNNNRGNYQVNDLGSTNGTFLNGEPVTEAIVETGSQISFGEVLAVLDLEDGANAGAEEAAADSGAGDGGAYTSGISADIAESSTKPADFKNLSPIEKVVKKDTLGMVAMLVGVVAIIAAIAVIGLAFTMKAA